MGGELARDGQTFFAQRIVSFLPETSRRRFHTPLRRLDLLPGRALYRDSRRKLEVLLDLLLLPIAACLRILVYARGERSAQVHRNACSAKPQSWGDTHCSWRSAGCSGRLLYSTAMKYRMTCSVDSFMRLPNPLLVNWQGKAVTFVPNTEGWFSEIRIVVRAPDPSLFRSLAPVDPETQSGSLSIQLDAALHEELLSDLQTIESFLGYYFNLRRINWSEVWAEVICETPEEESRNQIRRWRATPQVSAIPSEYDAKRFQTVLSAAARCKDLTATLAFYRQGENDLGDMRFISAFFNFFFVLEGFYSNGKTKIHQVEHEFQRSKILRGAIEKAVQQGLPRLWREDRPDIAATLKRINKPHDVDGIIHLLVWSRGDLHHFVNRPSVLKGSPLTDDHYEALAVLAGRICKIVIFDEISAKLATVPA